MATAEPRGSFVRWQSTRITQLTYAINLILSFSVAALGFQVSLLLGKEFTPVAWQKCAFSFSLLLLLASTGIGIWCVINRLRDFRATERAALMREHGSSNDEIEPYRKLYDKLGRRTWCLFWWQIGTFGFGILLAVLTVAASVGTKLL
jgi:hypothetical protein